MESTSRSTRPPIVENRPRMKGKLPSKQSTLPPSSPPSTNYRLNKYAKPQSQSDDILPLEHSNDDPFGILASERTLNVLKSRNTMDVIINSKPQAKVPQSLAVKGKTFGKENLGPGSLKATRATHQNVLSEPPSNRASSVSVTSPSKKNRRGLASLKHKSDSSKASSEADDGSHSETASGVSTTGNEDDEACNHLDSSSTHESVPEESEEKDQDITIRSLRTRNVTANQSTPKVTKKRATKTKRKGTRSTATKSKSKGGAKSDSGDSELDDFEDDSRETFLSERQARMEYFKHLESYEVAKENVYII